MRTKPNKFGIFRHWQMYVGLLLQPFFTLSGFWVGGSIGHHDIGGVIGAGVGSLFFGLTMFYVLRRYYPVRPE